jgi:translation elongation factor EF-G
MTSKDTSEVVVRVCKQAGEPGRYAELTIRTEPSEFEEFVNDAKRVEGFDDHFAQAAFDGIRRISQQYSWLTFRFIITDAKVHPVDSNVGAFRMAGEEAAKKLFQRICKS